MQRKTYRWIATAMAFAMVLGGMASAQSSEPACSVGFSNFMAYGSVGRSAYTATAKTTFEQRLPDGSYVRGYMLTHQARDAAGRTMFEMASGCRRDENGVPQPQLNVNVFDPVTKTSMSWQVNALYTDKVANVFHQPQTPPKPLTPEEQAARRKIAQAQQPPHSEYKREDLGMRTIAGVEAHGSRTTRTIPPGEEGNELPLVTVDEQWTAKDLGLTVMAIRDDPRRGRSTYEIEELSRSEPDPLLFEPPAGYKIVDLHPPSDIEAKP